MRLLVFDTSFYACSTAVIDVPNLTPSTAQNTGSIHNGSVLSASFEPMETGQAVRLMPMIEEVMAKASVTFNDLDAIATSPGPGTFTGVRIAVATARALALSTDLPTYGFSSLSLVAAKAYNKLPGDIERQQIAVTMDARREALYVQFFENPNDPPLSEPKLLGADEAVQLLSKPTVAVGTGAATFTDAAVQNGQTVISRLEDLQPDATFSAGVHMERMSPLKPLYLRPPDAKPQIGKSIPRVSP